MASNNPVSTSATVLSSQSLLAAMKVADKDQFLDQLRQAKDIEDQKYRETTSERLRREQRTHDQHVAEENSQEQNRQAEEDGIAAADRRLAEAVQGEKVRNRETEREQLRKNRLLTAGSSGETRTGFPMSPDGTTSNTGGSAGHSTESSTATLLSAGKMTGKLPRTLTMMTREDGTTSDNQNDSTNSLSFDTSSSSSSSFSRGDNVSDMSDKSQGGVFPMGDIRSGMTPFSSGQSSLATSPAATDGMAATPLSTQSLRGVFTEAILFSGVPLTATTATTATNTSKPVKSATSEKSEKSKESEESKKSLPFIGGGEVFDHAGNEEKRFSVDSVPPCETNSSHGDTKNTEKTTLVSNRPPNEIEPVEFLPQPTADSGGTVSLPTDMKILEVPETFQGAVSHLPPPMDTVLRNQESDGEAMDFRREADRSRFVRRVSTAVRHISAESEGVETIRMKLHPEELGAVTLVIRHREKQLEIRVETETAEAKSLIESQWEELQRELVALGFEPTPPDVRVSLP